ncbi:hypothetical protein Tco_1501069 [Tanacetum coccineum]
MLVSNEPWVVLADFNVIMNVDECSNSFNIVDRDMDIFRRVLYSLELEDIVSFVSSLYDFGSLPAIIVYPDVKDFKPRSFRFMNVLADKPNFLSTVKDNWYTEVQGFRMFVLAKRLKNIKKHLRNMNRLNGNVFDKVKVLRDELKRVQNSLDKDPDCLHLREEEYIYCNAYKEAAKDEEKVLRQKTRIQWLKDSDQNSAYFHNSLKGRMVRNRIEVVYDSDGNKYEGDDTAPKFVDHFRKFLGSEDEVFPIEDLDSLFINKLDALCADYMVRPVLDDEIKFAMFSIEDDKAAGLDGYSSKFFKAAWNIVRGDVCAAVKEFFSSSKLLGDFNANLISLVPKLQAPLNITNYRSIAYFNVVYKCISKEFMHGYGRKGGAQRCAIKVDIEKAYDTVNWEFLKTALHKFGFYSFMIKWIMIRLDSRFKYHWGCSKISLTHLCFVDDLLMLCHKDLISASILRRALDEFNMTSGLYPSMAKSTVFYSNVPDDVKEDIHLAMPFREGELPVRYLGILLTSKRLSIADCRVLVEKWPSEWSDLFSEVINVLVLVLSQDSVDKAIWFNKKNEEIQFSVKEAWKVLRIDVPKVMWIGFLDGLVLITWSVLFVKAVKTRTFIFSSIAVLRVFGIGLEDLSCVWAEIVFGISVRKANNTLWSIIQRLVFGAAVYFYWQERNFRLFRNVERPANKVFDIIMDTVRLRLLGLKIKRSSKVDKDAAIWKIPIKGVGEKSGYGVQLGAILVLELWILAWERRLLFSVPVSVVLVRSDGVGLGFIFGMESLGSAGLCRVHWFFLSLRGSQSFLYYVYGLTWFLSFVPMGSGGIRVFRLCSDKRRLSRLPLVDSGFVRISPWEGCKPGLDVSLWNGSFNHGTSGLGVLGYWGSGFPNYDARSY